jgi:hypothetical protein
MKFLMLLAVAALIVGGVYHTEVSRYVASLGKGSSHSASTSSVVNSFSRTGNSSNNLMNGVGNALDR